MSHGSSLAQKIEYNLYERFIEHLTIFLILLQLATLTEQAD